jgi:hypothetical protein
LETRRRDIGCRFSWKVFVIRDIDNRKDLEILPKSMVLEEEEASENLELV